MIVHQTDYLVSFFDIENSLFIQNWKKSPENTEVFKNEMLGFVKKYEEYNPSIALWLHKNFTLILDIETQNWAERHVVHPCVKAGNKKLAFVVSKDVFSHLSVVDSFDGLDINTPKHFISEKEALKWLIGDQEISFEPKESSVHFEGVDAEGNMLLKVRTSSEATEILRLFKGVKDVNSFYNKNLYKFNSLTKREKEVLLKYANGVSLSVIGETYNISIFTVRTHWRNIKKKLAIQSSIDTVKYIPFF